MNVAVYLRVSTADQSIEAQRLELTAHAKARGWTITREFSDTASGAKSDRPGLVKMMTLVSLGMLKDRQPREFDAILCVKLDRMARSLAHFARIVDELANADVALICTSQSIDTSKNNACGRLQMAVLAAVAEFERELIRERTKAGLAVARAAGKTLGKISTLMPDHSGRQAVLTQWRNEGRPGGYDELGRRLGGVSRATAMRVDKKIPPAVRELTVE